jgi:hypothetical protein
VQDRTALEMAKLREETMHGGEVIDFKKAKAKKWQISPLILIGSIIEGVFQSKMKNE